MPKLFKKISISFLLFFVLLTSIAPRFVVAQGATAAPRPTAPAEGTWYNQGFDQWYNKVYDENISPGTEIFGERYTAAQVQWVIYSIMAFFINGSLGNSSNSQAAVTCVLTNSGNIENCKKMIEDLLTAYQPSTQTSVASQIQDNNIFSQIFSDRPISGINYIRTLINKFDLVPEAEAQSPGFGFTALSVIQEMWKASRNIAYGLFVLAAIIFAFMIMFRVKINPQTVISVQSAIPKMIFAVILVTFSYAIAGFLVDLMYVVIGLLSLLLSGFMPGSGGLLNEPSMVYSLLTQGNFGGGIHIQSGVFGLIMIYLAPLLLSLLVLAVMAGLLQQGLIAIIVLLLFVIVVVIAIVMTFKTIFALFKAFANLLLLTIFAPIQLSLGILIPNMGFGSWIKTYISHLSVFVVTGVLWYLSIVFLTQGVLIGAVGLAPTLLGSFGGIIASFVDPQLYYVTWPPLLGFGNAAGTGLLLVGVSFVFFTLISKATEIIQGFLSGKPFAYGSAVGEALNVFGIGTIAQKTAQDAAIKSLYFRDARGETSGLIPDLWARARNRPRGASAGQPGGPGGHPTT